MKKRHYESATFDSDDGDDDASQLIADLIGQGIGQRSEDDTQTDVWSAGCIYAEMVQESGKPLFMGYGGDDEVGQLIMRFVSSGKSIRNNRSTTNRDRYRRFRREICVLRGC
eukprot:GHVQ01034344.1.p2 GENE.GHVQ01034344.1~~GHVQ01034344.1.p2  ORF type:complete len:112 (-),score=19.59 GHVQ01034344.1:781-1116(-)